MIKSKRYQFSGTSLVETLVSSFIIVFSFSMFVIGYTQLNTSIKGVRKYSRYMNFKNSAHVPLVSTGRNTEGNVFIIHKDSLTGEERKYLLYDK